MDHPARQDPAAVPANAAGPDDLSPYLLSREYEDHLDWLENQRDTRVKRRRRGRPWLTTLSSFATVAVALAGTMLRRR